MATFPEVYRELETALEDEDRYIARHKARWHRGGACHEPYAGRYGCSGAAAITRSFEIEDRMMEVA